MAPREPVGTPAARWANRVLRVGIVQGGRIIEERLIRDRKTVSIGQGPRNSLVISSANLPRRFEVFAPCASGYELRFAPGMDGRITLGDGVRTLSQIREQQLARPAGDGWHLPLQPDSRGKLVVGDVTILFQLVLASPVVPHARLPATIRGGMTGPLDRLFTSTLGGCLVLGLLFGVAAQLVPRSRPTPSRRIRQLVEASARAVADPHRTPQTMAADRAAMDAGMEERGGFTAAAPTASSPGKQGTDRVVAERARTEFARGSEGYRNLMDEVTRVAIAGGGGTMGSIVIAGQCSGADCEKATVGVDGLRNGRSTTDLDDVASSSGASGASTRTGPGSGRPGHGGVVRGGRPDGAITGRVVGTAPGIPGADAPMAVVKLQAKLTPFVPVPRGLERGAGDRIRKKVASLVYGLRFCYNRALQSNPRLQGAVKVSVVILPSGRLTSVSVESGMGGGVAECIQGRVQSWSLGDAGQQAFYTFTLQFAPGGG